MIDNLINHRSKTGHEILPLYNKVGFTCSNDCRIWLILLLSLSQELAVLFRSYNIRVDVAKCMNDDGFINQHKMKRLLGD